MYNLKHIQEFYWRVFASFASSVILLWILWRTIRKCKPDMTNIFDQSKVSRSIMPFLHTENCASRIFKRFFGWEKDPLLRYPPFLSLSIFALKVFFPFYILVLRWTFRVSFVFIQFFVLHFVLLGDRREEASQQGQSVSISHGDCPTLNERPFCSLAQLAKPKHWKSFSWREPWPKRRSKHEHLVTHSSRIFRSNG